MSSRVAELVESLAAVEYPGRGLALGRDSGGQPFALYWLTGRSPASQERRLSRPSDGQVLVHDTTGSADDPLRHYAAYEVGPGIVTVGNGTHVSDIAAAVRTTRDFPAALAEHDFEPDAPIRTPRIAGVASLRGDAMAVAVGGARSCPASVDESDRVCVSADDVPPGWVLTVNTYRGGAQNVSTDGTPRWLSVADPVGELPKAVWNALDGRFRVAVSCAILTDGTRLGDVVFTGLHN
ncbi:IMP cyclohydrolase [Streptomyces sp. NPDC020898]|uniref:IMP cyclohydrolase n=1 Tax=Streptomyces sp. NPDC020898 TaxID=3365101 RepID=UPI003791F4E0